MLNYIKSKIPFFYGKTKLLLAFEYAIILLSTANEQKVVITPEIIKRAEKILVKEFSSKTPTRLSTEMVPNILAMLEPDDKIKM